MTVYSQSQIEKLWVQYGGNPQYAKMASAIAMAESGGNSAPAHDKVPDSNGTYDRGLFQINSIHGAMSTEDVATNVRAAIQISGNGTNWRPWCTAWSDGLCGSRGGTFLGTGSPVLRYLTGSVPTTATSGTGGTTPAQTTASILDPSTWFNSLIRPSFQYVWWFGETMVGLGMVAVGVILLGGITIKPQPTPPQPQSTTKKVVETAATAATGGEAKVAAKAAKPKVYQAKVNKPQPPRPEPSRHKTIDGEVVQRKELAA